MLQPSPPGRPYLRDADLLQAHHLGAMAHPAGQGHLQDFAVICEGSGERSCQGPGPERHSPWWQRSLSRDELPPVPRKSRS